MKVKKIKNLKEAIKAYKSNKKLYVEDWADMAQAEWDRQAEYAGYVDAMLDEMLDNQLDNIRIDIYQPAVSDLNDIADLIANNKSLINDIVAYRYYFYKNGYDGLRKDIDEFKDFEKWLDDTMAYDSGSETHEDVLYFLSRGFEALILNLKEYSSRINLDKSDVSKILTKMDLSDFETDFGGDNIDKLSKHKISVKNLDKLLDDASSLYNKIKSIFKGLIDLVVDYIDCMDDDMDKMLDDWIEKDRKQSEFDSHYDPYGESIRSRTHKSRCIESSNSNYDTFREVAIKNGWEDLIYKFDEILIPKYSMIAVIDKFISQIEQYCEKYGFEII